MATAACPRMENALRESNEPEAYSRMRPPFGAKGLIQSKEVKPSPTLRTPKALTACRSSAASNDDAPSKNTAPMHDASHASGRRDLGMVGPELPDRAPLVVKGSPVD